MDKGMKIVYVITERNQRSYWNRIGVAFVNGDGSLNVKLEALPVSGEMQIRDYVPRETVDERDRRMFEPLSAESSQVPFSLTGGCVNCSCYRCQSRG